MAAVDKSDLGEDIIYCFINFERNYEAFKEERCNGLILRWM